MMTQTSCPSHDDSDMMPRTRPAPPAAWRGRESLFATRQPHTPGAHPLHACVMPLRRPGQPTRTTQRDSGARPVAMAGVRAPVSGERGVCLPGERAGGQRGRSLPVWRSVHPSLSESVRVIPSLSESMRQVSSCLCL
jgi:hypothetical protein